MTNATETRHRRRERRGTARRGPSAWRHLRRLSLGTAAGILMLGILGGTASADPASNGYKHPDQTATTYRTGDDVTIAFWCEHRTEATKAANDGLAEIYHEISIGNCNDARPSGLKVVLKDFESGPYWFGDDTLAWSLWSVTEKGGTTVFALVPDSKGPHKVLKPPHY